MFVKRIMRQLLQQDVFRKKKRLNFRGCNRLFMPEKKSMKEHLDRVNRQ